MNQFVSVSDYTGSKIFKPRTNLNYNIYDYIAFVSYHTNYLEKINSYHE